MRWRYQVSNLETDHDVAEHCNDEQYEDEFDALIVELEAVCLGVQNAPEILTPRRVVTCSGCQTKQRLI